MLAEEVWLILVFLMYFIDYAVTVVPFFPYLFPSSLHSSPTHITPFSSCPRVIHITSLSSPFPILFLTSPCLFCTYLLRFLIPAPFPSLSLFPLPLSTDNPLCDLHFCDSVPVLVICLVCFCFCFRF